MSAKIMIATATTVCAIGITVCLAYIVLIVNDINHFVDDVTHDLEAFKEKADDAWREMVPVSRSSAHSNFDALLA
ncbi:unnamed protein product, partial [Heligmosomoides polygyrus]|uniref:Col_cuticle_N domain-containing protein n=1 Tax=Heligmosomoides polygyrus TaxID=6339 RepID=A0A183GPD8_HELPZ